MNSILAVIAVIFSPPGLTLFSQPLPAGNSAISGTVIDEKGKGVPGATMLLHRLAEYKSMPSRGAPPKVSVVSPGASMTLTAGKDGQFSATGLAPGRYEVCAYGDPAKYAGSCEWAGVPLVQLGPGQSLSGLTRTLLDAAQIRISVADPRQRLSGGTKLSIGVGDRKYFRRAVLGSKGASERVYKVTVPANRAVSLRIDADKPLSVVDDASRPVEVGRFASQSISVAAGTAPAIAFTIQ